MSVTITHGLVLDRMVGNIDWGQLTRTSFVWVRATSGRGEDRKWRRHTDEAAEAGLSVATLHEAVASESPEAQADFYLPHLVGKTAILRLDKGWRLPNTSGGGSSVDSPELDLAARQSAWISRYCHALPDQVTVRVVADRRTLTGIFSGMKSYPDVGWFPAVNEPAEHAPTPNSLQPIVGVADRSRQAGTTLTHWLWNDAHTIRQASGPVGRVVRIRHT